MCGKKPVLKFNQHIQEQSLPTQAPSYVIVRGGRVELRRMDSGSASATFANGATTAVLQGNVVVVTLKNGKVVLYKLSKSGNSVSGPYVR